MSDREKVVMSDSRSGGKLLLGAVVLHVPCCGLPLLTAAGVVTSVGGGLLRNPLMLAVGVGTLIAVVLPALRRAGATRDDEFCAPPGAPTSSADDLPLDLPLGPGR
jgi:hypothetical protein